MPMKASIFPFTCILVVTSACSSFLDEPQDNRTSLDTVEKVNELLVNAYTNAQYAAFAEAMSDNATDKGPESSIIRTNETGYLWEDNESIEGNDTPTNFWVQSYESIAHANHALAALDALNDDDNAAVKGCRGEALLARAYAHFMLVNLFCMRYDPATADSEPGVPYVTAPEEDAMVDYARESMAENYRHIEEDMTAGLALISNDYKEPKFHFTIKAAHALACRFYLYTGEWQKVIDHANIVMGNTSPALVVRDIVSSDFKSRTYSERTQYYHAVTERSNLLVAWVNSFQGRYFASYRYGMSTDMTSTMFYDKSTNPFRKDWGYDIYGIDLYRNIPKYVEFFRITNASAGTGFAYAAMLHFTHDELVLNRAEAYVMLNQFDNAAADLTAYLSQKIEGFDESSDVVLLDSMKSTYPVIENEYTPFYELTEDQTAFIKGIAEFKRREFYHEGMRWFDVKRFNLEVVHPVYDEPDITLPKDDPRRAVQIPESAQAFGIEANRR